ncbi:MAG TPA: DUF885 domain-containing protein [Steroidobacteraceae bacterium]|nr:DUF885 domain-containing protein [Steroidobacteraceae bacterium]
MNKIKSYRRAVATARAAICLITALAGGAVAGLAGCVATPPPPPAAPPGPSEADLTFQALAKRYLDEMNALTPVNATSLGDHRFDGKLDDVSPSGYDRRVALARELLGQLQAIDPTQLARANQVDARLLENELSYSIWQIETLSEWRWNPLIYTDMAGNSIYQLLSRDFAPLPDRLRDIEARLTELPRFLEQVRESLVPAKVPKIHAETAIKQNPGLLTVIDQLVIPQLHVLPEADQAKLRAAITQAHTAVSQHQLWLEKKLLSEAKGNFRLGADLYDAKLRFVLDSPLTREEIHDRARAELVRTRAEMYNIARTVLQGEPGPPRPPNPTQEEQQAAIAAALEIAYAQHPSRDQVFDTARRALAETTQFVREHDLVTVYDDPLEIIPMPEFERGVSLAYCDSPGPLDRGQKTYYVISPIPEDWTDTQVRSFLREYNTRSIDDLTIHEAMPGHYLQLMHANRYDSPLRAVLASGSFIEGWAVYAERMMVEQGFMDNDPLMHLIQLKWYLRTIANAILDQAVHVDGISRDEAMRLMTVETFQEEREASAKWVRAQLTSAQLPTYFVGVQEHLALREELKKKWGKSFTLKRYHDTVLSFGSPPVRYVRELALDLPIQ